MDASGVDLKYNYYIVSRNPFSSSKTFIEFLK